MHKARVGSMSLAGARLAERRRCSAWRDAPPEVGRLPHLAGHHLLGVIKALAPLYRVLSVPHLLSDGPKRLAVGHLLDLFGFEDFLSGGAQLALGGACGGGDAAAAATASCWALSIPRRSIGMRRCQESYLEPDSRGHAAAARAHDEDVHRDDRAGFRRRSGCGRASSGRGRSGSGSRRFPRRLTYWPPRAGEPRRQPGRRYGRELERRRAWVARKQHGMQAMSREGEAHVWQVS